MIDTAEISRLNNLSKEIEKTYKTLRIEEYNAPLNREDERERLFKSHDLGKPYNPQFIYRTCPREFEKPLQKIIRKIQPERNYWEHLLFRDVKQTLDTLGTLFTHDPSQITASSIASDGIPTSQLVQDAYTEISKSEAQTEQTTVTAEEASQVIRKVLDDIQLLDWDVVIDGVMSANMMVRSIEKKIKIRGGKMFSPHAVKRLLVHEVGTHVFRYVNGITQKIHLFRLGLSGHNMTEEGIALYHEEKYNLRDLTTTRRYALRVIAAHLSLTHSYYDVFAFIAEHTDREDAFDIVSRAKRGFIDTSEYGSHTKDKVYFEGFHKICEYLLSNPSDYDFLMGGKISLEMLPFVKDANTANLFVPPRYLPELLEPHLI